MTGWMSPNWSAFPKIFPKILFWTIQAIGHATAKIIRAVDTNSERKSMTIQEVIDQCPTLFPGVVTLVSLRVQNTPNKKHIKCGVCPDWENNDPCSGYGPDWETALNEARAAFSRRGNRKAERIAELKAELAKLEAA